MSTTRRQMHIPYDKLWLTTMCLIKHTIKIAWHQSYSFVKQSQTSLDFCVVQQSVNSASILRFQECLRVEGQASQSCST